MQTLKVNPQKTLADYGYKVTPKTTQVQVEPLNSLRLTVRDWWTSLSENLEVPIIIHVFGQSDIYAHIIAETEKALRLSIPRPTMPPLERWIPKTAVIHMQEVNRP